MFNINLMQQRLKEPMTIEMIPNYRRMGPPETKK
jgi:hypothetical protein